MAEPVSIRVEGLWKHYGLSDRPGIGQLARAVLARVGAEPTGR